MAGTQGFELVEGRSWGRVLIYRMVRTDIIFFKEASDHDREISAKIIISNRYTDCSIMIIRWERTCKF